MGLLDIFRRKGRDLGVRTLDVEDGTEIREKIRSLCKQRQSCDILVGDELYSSIFLKIERDRILIDLMIPLAGNTIIRNGQGVRIGFLERRIPYSMNCIYQGRVIEGGYESLAFTLPTVVRYSNRRAYYRVKPEPENPLRVLLDLGLSNISDASVENISGGGLAVRSKLITYMQPGTIIDRVDIVLPNGGWISCTGKVIRLQGQLVGIHLEEISFNDRRSIVRYVAERQQDEIAKMHLEE